MIKNIKVQNYSDEMEIKYNEFIKKHKDSMFYHSIKFKKLLEELLEATSDYKIIMHEKHIVSIMPLFFKDGKFGRVYNSLPYYGSNGSVITSNEIYLNVMLSYYKKLVNGKAVCSSTLIENPHKKYELSILECNETDYRIGQWTSINYKNNIEESIMLSYESSARRNVRKAIKSNVEVEVDNTQIEFLYDTHYENITSIDGKVKDKKFFELIGKYFEPGVDYNIYIAKLDGQKIGALLLFYWNNTVEYFTPAIVSKYRNVQALPLAIYQAMCDASKKGYIWWNWGGTWRSQEGVMKFKSKFGAIDKKYNYFIKIHNQDIYTLSKEELLKEYDNFYVIPFNKLKG